MKRIGALIFVCAVGAIGHGTWSVQRLVALDYPRLAQLALIQGRVELSCRIGTAGEVIDCKANSGHPILQIPAIANAKKWRFSRRAGKDGDPGNVLLEYEFVLTQTPPVRRQPEVEFSFEYPNHVKVVSEKPCPDHLPCTPEELKELERQDKDQTRHGIP